MRRILSDEGMRVLLEAQLLEVRGRSGDKVTLVVSTPSGERNIDGSDILVAVGRIPNSSGIGLQDTGVELDGRGYIRVNDRLETSAPGVWALGECAGSPQEGPAEEVLKHPRHDYTRMLIAAIPSLDPKPLDPKTGPITLETVKLGKSYGGGLWRKRVALRHVLHYNSATIVQKDAYAYMRNMLGQKRSIGRLRLTLAR